MLMYVRGSRDGAGGNLRGRVGLESKARPLEQLLLMLTVLGAEGL